MENYEKIRLLREWAVEAPYPSVNATMQALDKVLKDFSWPRGETAGIHADDVARTRAAITAATRALHR